MVAPVGSGSNQIGWLPLWVFGRMFGFYDMMGDCSEVRNHLRVVPGVVPQTIFSFFFRCDSCLNLLPTAYLTASRRLWPSV